MGTRYAYAVARDAGLHRPDRQHADAARWSAAPPRRRAPLRVPASVTDVLNNVAVPGARVLDPTSPSTAASNALTTFILGGKSQVQKALDAQPDLRHDLDRQQRRPRRRACSGILVADAAPGQNGIIEHPGAVPGELRRDDHPAHWPAPGLKGVLIGVAAGRQPSVVQRRRR